MSKNKSKKKIKSRNNAESAYVATGQVNEDQASNLNTNNDNASSVNSKTIKYKNDLIYIGECNEAGEPFGEGKMIIKDRVVYTGTVKGHDNSGPITDGYGRFNFKEGGTYEGFFENRKFCKKGRFFLEIDGECQWYQEGEFKNNKFFGKVSYFNKLFPEKVFEGYLDSNCRLTGEGWMNLKIDGIYYVGSAKDGVPLKGHIVYTNNNNIVEYDSSKNQSALSKRKDNESLNQESSSITTSNPELANAEYNSQPPQNSMAQISYPNGLTYKGEINEKGLPDKKGAYHYKNGDVIDKDGNVCKYNPKAKDRGIFEKNLHEYPENNLSKRKKEMPPINKTKNSNNSSNKNLQRVIKYNNGLIYEGKVDIEGKPCDKKGIVKNSEGLIIYNGGVKGDNESGPIFHGRGVLKTKNYLTFDGHFENDIFCKKGKVSLIKNGEIHWSREGNYKNNKINGKVKYTNRLFPGKVFEGFISEDGKLSGNGFCSFKAFYYVGEVKDNKLIKGHIIYNDDINADVKDILIIKYDQKEVEKQQSLRANPSNQASAASSETFNIEDFVNPSSETFNIEDLSNIEYGKIVSPLGKTVKNQEPSINNLSAQNQIKTLKYPSGVIYKGIVNEEGLPDIEGCYFYPNGDSWKVHLKNNGLDGECIYKSVHFENEEFVGFYDKGKIIFGSGRKDLGNDKYYLGPISNNMPDDDSIEAGLEKGYVIDKGYVSEYKKSSNNKNNINSSQNEPEYASSKKKISISNNSSAAAAAAAEDDNQTPNTSNIGIFNINNILSDKFQRE
jgi:hypothetical protein